MMLGKLRLIIVQILTKNTLCEKLQFFAPNAGGCMHSALWSKELQDMSLPFCRIVSVLTRPSRN